MDFLEQADRFHGIWPHWIYGETGRIKPFSQKDNGADGVESDYLFQGLLMVRQYFTNGNEQERALAERIDRLWREAEWDWFRKDNENVLYWHWSAEYNWFPKRYLSIDRGPITVMIENYRSGLVWIFSCLVPKYRPVWKNWDLYLGSHPIIDFYKSNFLNKYIV
ncbi:MAG: hypothetical protein JXB19_04570 [Bacteroidales bacterium]|nr:hypothetical protein [Bacteroidales bacterium]